MNRMDLSSDDRDALEALLVFYRDGGIVDVIGDEPVNAFALQTPPRPEPRQAPTPAQPLAAPVRLGQAAIDAEAAAQTARTLAQTARTLDELRAALEAFDGCALKATASRLVFEDGARNAPLMLVGEAPGADEDRQGKPFVGRSGQLLDRILAAAGFDRTSVYIANVAPWRPPGNRTPTPQEAAICLPFIERQIELCAPKVLMCLGAPSAQTLLGIREGILKARGKWMEARFGALTLPAMASLHPAYLLRSPIGKRAAWQDMLNVRMKLETLG